MCPICTIAVGAGIGFSRWLGIDDTITGLWIGGLFVSLTGWTINWLRKKQWTFKGMPIITTLAYLVLIIVPLFWMGLIGHPLNVLWGIDKLVLGIVLGTFFFVAGATLHGELKKGHGGTSYFPFQKVVFPVAPLILASILFYFLTR